MNQVLHFIDDYRTYIFIVLLLIITFVVNRVVRLLISKFIESSSRDINSDPTKYVFLKNMISMVIYSIATLIIVYTIPSLKAIAVTLFASAGILAAIVGFSSQQALSNIISGIFIVIFKPYRVGDFIKVGTGETFGIVEDITLRHTVIKSFENQRVIIPNSVISSETIINASISDSRTCMFVEMSISYDANIDKAIELMRDEALSHKSCIDNRTPDDKDNGMEQVIVRVIGFGDSSVNLRAYVWAIDPVVGTHMRFDLYESIKKRFDREGIEIPFPYRTIVYKKDILKQES